LALVPVTGQPSIPTKSQVMACRGWRTPTVPVPPVTKCGSSGRAGKIMVKGPGQKRVMSRLPTSGTSRATWDTISWVATNNNIGFPPGRCLRAKSRVSASSLKGCTAKA
jgi:hypothetical protein